MKEVLSLGAGVQSSTVLLMSCVGELPKLDAAIFADTGWEPPAVYEHLKYLKGEAEKAGIPVFIVSKGNIRNDTIDNQVTGSMKGCWASMPFRTRNEKGEVGIVRRQCTSEYKIKPLKKKQRELIGLKPRQRAPKEPVMRLWFGISIDEVYRMRDSPDRWQVYHYPLIDKGFSRLGCLEWVKDHGFPEPPRSACIGCPFHSDYEWRDMKVNRPEEWADAVEFDEAIRVRRGMRNESFLHKSATPLAEVDLENEFDKGQLSLWNNECEGMCGV